jgi:carbon-monoxide dehydrogenase large subunit
MDVELQNSQPKFVGARVTRVEDRRHLLGRAEFVSDIRRSDELALVFLRSAVPHARITHIDRATALSIPGVVDLVTGPDVEGQFAPIVGDIRAPGARHTERPIVAHDHVRFVGEIIGMILAETRYIAEDALDVVGVDYEPLPPVTDAEAALRPDAALLHPELDWPDNCMLRLERSLGDVDAAFSGRRTLKSTYRSSRTTAMALETRGCLAEWDERTATITVWSSTQIPHLLRSFIAKIGGFPETQLRVIAPDVGGGFGQKATIYPEEVIAAHLAKRTRRPVKWISDRREDILSSHHAREHIHEIEVAYDDEGVIHGVRARIIANAGAYSISPWSGAMEAGMAASNLPGPYAFQNYAYEHLTVMTNKTPIGPYRGVGRPAACFSIERAMDDVAHALGKDPLDVRLANTVRQYPHTTASGMVLDSGSSYEALEKMSELIGWVEFRQRQERARAEGIYLGIGLAQYAEQTGHSMVDKGLLVDASFESATARMEPDGTVLILSGSLGHGQGHETVFAQLAADEIGVPLEDVRVVQGDTAAIQYGIGTFASRSAVLGGGAVVLASRELSTKLRAFAGRQLEVSDDDLELVRGSFRVRGAPDRTVSIKELAWQAYSQAHLIADLGAGLSTTNMFSTPQPKGTYANSLHAVVVEVDPSTGRINIERYVVIHDCGKVINPLIVDGQVHGGTIQGLGQALFEHVAYGDDGQPITTSLMDYLLPSSPEMPAIETYHMETLAPNVPLGIKGMGEGGAIAPGPAIANAVTDALLPFGVSMDQLPVTPERVLRAIHEANGVQPVAAG